MAEKFDPYRKWLGIPPDEQPPNHYRLLGIGLFERDPDVISNAADRQMVHVRTFQSGKYSKVSQRILNELSAARVCLLDPDKKKRYDEQLRTQLALEQAPAPPPPPSSNPPPPPPPGGPVPPVQNGFSIPQMQAGPGTFPTTPSRSLSTAYGIRRRRSSWHMPAITIGMVLVGLLLLVWALNSSTDEAPREHSPRTNKHTDKSPTDFHSPGDRSGRPSGRRPPRRPSARTGPLIPNRTGPGPADQDRTGIDRDVSDPLGEICSLEGHEGRVFRAVFSPDGEFIFSGGEDRLVRLWDVAAGRELRRFAGSANPVFSVAVSPDGRTVAASSGQSNPPGEGAVQIWETAGGQQTARIDTSSLKIAHDVVFSPHGDLLLLAGQDDTVRLVEPSSGKETGRFAGHDGPVRAVAFSLDGQRILSGSDDRTMRLWNRATGKEIRSFIGHSGPVTSVAFSPDGKRAVSGSADHFVRIWNLETGRKQSQLEGHTGEVTSVAYSPDGTRVLSGSTDGTIRVWQAPDGKPLHRFEAHKGGVRSVAFSSNGLRAVTCGNDRMVRLWGLPADLPSADPTQTPGEGPGGKSSEELVEIERVPVPDAPAREKAEKLIKTEVFKKDFEAADRPSRKGALARKLLQEGVNTKDDTASAYVLLRLARELAVETADTDTALAAVDEIGRRYEVDGLDIKVSTLETASKLTTASSGKRTLVEKMLLLLDQAVAADDYGAAGRLAILARSTVAKARDGTLSKRVAQRAIEVQELKEAYEDLRQALAALDKQPDDAQANETVGKYFCLVKGDWQRGLPMLAKASDPALKQLAEADLAGPEDVQQQVALADKWWDLAEKQAGKAQQHAKQRAAVWYKQAEPAATGLVRSKVERRLLEVGDPNAPPSGPDLLPKIEGLECREGSAKETLLAALGGNAGSEAAVRLALEWLANHQKSDGSWNFNHHGSRCQGRCGNPGTLEKAPNAATALALLPFLGAGEGPRSGKHRKAIVSGLQFLRSRLRPVGPTAGTLYEPDARSMPSHALGTIALCEASCVARDKTSRVAAQATVNFIVATQNADGGWGNRPRLSDTNQGDSSSISTTGWNLAALQTARWAGLKVPQKPFDQVVTFLDTLQTDDKKGYRREPGNSHADELTAAVGFLSRMYLGWPRNRTELQDYVVQLSQTGPAGNGRFYLDYLNTLVMRNYAGPAWQTWNPAIRDSLISQQKQEGHEAGSWFLPGPTSNTQGGRLYCTALAALILESYYRHPPLY